MSEFNNGCMPNTDFKYEEFEGLLADYAMSLSPLMSTGDPEDLDTYKTATSLLNGFSERHKVQSVGETMHNGSRSKEEWAQPKVHSNWSIIDLLGSFWRDFGVGYVTKEEGATKQTKLDASERNKLGRLILGVFAKYGIASIAYQKHEGEKIPCKIEEWSDLELKTLGDSIMIHKRRQAIIMNM